MAGKVLVAYGSRYGGTAEIAEKIGEILNQEGVAADVVSADRAGSLDEYDAFVIGSGVYAGMWRKDAVKFMVNNEKLLAGKPVWIFSSGPTGDESIEETMKEWKYPVKITQQIERISPKDITIFYGVVYPEKLNPFFKLILKMIKAPTGDFRDWDAIASWAKGIAAGLKK